MKGEGSRRKKRYKWVIGLGLFITATAIGLLIILQVPSVQKHLLQKLNDYLTAQLNTRIYIGEVDIDFFDNLTLHDIYVEDLSADTLVYIQNLSIDIGFFSLLKKEVYIDQIKIKDLKLNLKKKSLIDSSDYEWNFDFLLAGSGSTSTSDSWNIGLQRVIIETYQISSIDNESAQEVIVEGGQLSIGLDQLGLDKKIIDIQEIKIDDTSIELYTSDGSHISSNAKNDSSDIFRFPDLVPDIGWAINAKAIMGQRNLISYISNTKRGKEKSNQSVDYNNIQLSAVQYEFRNFSIDSTVEAEVINVSFNEKSGLQLDHLSLELLADRNTATLSNFNLRTPNSKIIGNGKLDITSSLSASPRITLKLDHSLLGIQDAIFLSPIISEYTNLKSSEYINISADISTDLEQLKVRNLSLKISKRLEVQSDYTSLNINDFSKSPFKVDNAIVSTSSGGMKHILKNIDIPKELAILEKFTVRGSFTGDMNDLQFRDLQLTSGSGIKSHISGNIKNVTHPQSSRFNINVHDLSSPLQPLSDYLSGIDQRLIDSIGFLSYQGTVLGQNDTVVVTGAWHSRIGSVLSHLALSSVQGTSNTIAYKGTLSSDRLLLRGLLDSAYLQDIALTINLDGTADPSNGIKADIVSHVSNLSTRDYVMANIDIKLGVTKDSLQVHLDIDDPKLIMRSHGTARLQPTLSNINLTTKIETMDLVALHLSEEISNLSFNGQLESNSTNLDSILTSIHLSDLIVTSDSTTTILPTFHLNIDQTTPENKTIRLRSDIVDADINGSYQLTELPTTLKSEFRKLFPFISLLNDDSIIQEVPDERQSMTVIINTKNVSALNALMLNEIGLDSSNLKLEIVPTIPYPILNGHLSSLRYNDLSISHLDLSTSEKDNINILTIDARDIIYSQQRIAAAYSTITLAEDQIGYDINLSQDSADILLDVVGALTWESDKYYNIFQKNIVLNNSTWQVDENNYFGWSTDSLYINNFRFLNKDNDVTIGDKHELITSLADQPISIFIKGFSLLNLTSPFVSAAQIDGDVNGTANVYYSDQGIKVNSDIRINQLTIDSSLVGDMELRIDNERKVDKSFGKVEITASIKGDENEIDLQASYDPISNRLELHQKAKKVSLQQFNPFTTATLVTTSGSLNGEVDIEGALDDLIFKADIGISNLSTTPLAMGTSLMVDSERLSITNNSILFNDFNIEDRRGRVVTLNGQVAHQNFKDATFDATIYTEGFEMLNTNAKDNASFFGRLILAATGTVKGPITSPILQLSATTLDSTNISIFPFLETQIQTSNNTIIFTTLDDFLNGTSKTVAREEQFPFTMRLSLEVTDKAVLQFIVDPITGDKLVCKGNANLNLFLPSSGVPEIFGNYTATSGSYTFSYNNLLRKNFELVPGSTVSFSGDPLNATLNAGAQYSTQTSVYELIKDQTNLSQSELSMAKKRYPVDIKMSFKGELSEPQIGFDIKMNQSNQLSEIVDERLTELNQNPNDLNNQVFSLLLLNNFVPASKNAENNGLTQGLGATQALSSMSKIFTDQLNNLSNKYIKGVDLNFKVDSYQLNNQSDQSNNLVTELGLGISKQLLNDRLKLEVSGSVDIENTDQANDFTSIAGDFLLEYKLSENGNYLLRVFRRSNLNNLTDERDIKNGVGIYIKKAFDDRGN